MNQLLDKVYDLYIETKIGRNDICLKCKQTSINKNKELII